MTYSNSIKHTCALDKYVYHGHVGLCIIVLCYLFYTRLFICFVCLYVYYCVTLLIKFVDYNKDFKIGNLICLIFLIRFLSSKSILAKNSNFTSKFPYLCLIISHEIAAGD